jgi:hypothetical protein
MTWKILGYSLYLLLPFTLFLFPLMPYGVALIAVAHAYCLERGQATSAARRYQREARWDSERWDR